MSAAHKEDSACRVGKKVWQAILRERDGDKAFRLTEATLVACIRGPLLVEFPKAAATTKTGGRDLIFDAIAECAGFDLDGLTRVAAKEVATAKRDILEATPNVTAEEIIKRCAAYRKEWPTIGKPAPMALARHWSRFGRHVAAPKPAAAPKLAYSRENPPDGQTWRYAARYQAEWGPHTDLDALCALDWPELSDEAKGAILTALNK